MGQPAARVGDMTAHGTPLSPGPGSSNVLIGGKPAWRAAADFHTCPLVTGIVPHVGGVVTMGSATVLIQHDVQGRTEYTALTVLDGFESSMTDSYIRARAPGGQAIGSFHDRTAALAKARQLCPPAGEPAAAREASAR